MDGQSLPPVALSIRQPWAWAILHAGKRIENRNWHTKVRGPICIHAAKGCTRFEYEDAKVFIEEQSGVWVPPLNGLDRGGIVGTAEIVDCVDRAASPWFFGQYGFVLANIRAVPLIPARGALGFFKWKQAADNKPEQMGLSL